MQIHRRIPPYLDSQLPQAEVTVLRPNIILHVGKGHTKTKRFPTQDGVPYISSVFGLRLGLGG